MSARPRPEGFALVEVLVSMLVVALGILALAGLLQSALRQARASEQRAVATLLAEDIAERIRVNAAGARMAAGGYDMVAPGFPAPPPPAARACTEAAPCAPGELAAADLAAWCARLRAALPGGSARIRWRAGVAPAPEAVDVWLGWSDPNAPAATVAADAEGSGSACPQDWSGADSPVRCVYLEVAP